MPKHSIQSNSIHIYIQCILQHGDYCNFTQFNRNSSGIIAQPIYMTLQRPKTRLNVQKSFKCGANDEWYTII